MSRETQVERAKRFRFLDLPTEPPPEFIAPVWRPSGCVYVWHNGLFRFRFEGAEPGWHIFRPEGERAVITKRPKQVERVREYLSALPSFLVIAVPLEEGLVAVPWNRSDAAQRGWHEKFRPLRLAPQLRTFDVVRAAALGKELLFDHVELRGRQTLAERARQALVNGAPLPHPFDRVATDVGISPPDPALSTFEEQLRFWGAELVDVREGSDAIEVRWLFRGREFESRVDESGRILSAGLCLSGRDREHNLSSLVRVIEEALQEGIV